jgi:hypothetical protein
MRALAGAVAPVYGEQTLPLGACGSRRCPCGYSTRWHGRKAYPGLIRPIKMRLAVPYRSVSNQKNRPAKGPFRGIVFFAVIARPCDPRRGAGDGPAPVPAAAAGPGPGPLPRWS